MIDSLALRDQNALDQRGALGGERGFHFHRFDYDQGLAGLD
jgi:hypothetical protein